MADNKAFIRSYPAHTHGYYFDQYHVMAKSKYGKGSNLLKAFYSRKDAERYRDMLNKKIPMDEKWMMEV